MTPVLPSTPGPRSTPALAAAEQAALARADPYVRLGVAPGAGFDALRARMQVLHRQHVQDLGAAQSDAQRRLLQAEYLAAFRAFRLLEDPVTRLRHDAEAGNLAGVAHCLAAGVEPEQVREARAAYLAGRPGAADTAWVAWTWAYAHLEAGNPEAAAAALERALGVDPLNLGLHHARSRLPLHAAPAGPRPATRHDEEVAAELMARVAALGLWRTHTLTELERGEVPSWQRAVILDHLLLRHFLDHPVRARPEFLSAVQAEVQLHEVAQRLADDARRARLLFTRVQDATGAALTAAADAVAEAVAALARGLMLQGA